MAASNDNQGLKIAVAALVMLVFILGVTNYFAFSSSSREAARAEAASKAASDSESKARTAVEQYNYARTALGYLNIDDHEAPKTALTKDAAKISSEIQAYGQETQAAVA